MENYKKAVIRELDTQLVLPPAVKVGSDGATDGNAVVITVKTGTKMRNVLAFGFKQLERSSLRHIVWQAEGEAVAKAVSCAEIMKRGDTSQQHSNDKTDDSDPKRKSPSGKAKNETSNAKNTNSSRNNQSSNSKRSKPMVLYQTNILGYKRSEEIWEPVVQGLDKLKVNKDVPILAIILSKDEIGPKDLAQQQNSSKVTTFQPPGIFDAFWLKRTNQVLHSNNSNPVPSSS